MDGSYDGTYGWIPVQTLAPPSPPHERPTANQIEPKACLRESTSRDGAVFRFLQRDHSDLDLRERAQLAIGHVSRRQIHSLRSERIRRIQHHAGVKKSFDELDSRPDSARRKLSAVVRKAITSYYAAEVQQEIVQAATRTPNPFSPQYPIHAPMKSLG
jgi:hypothetical protein